MTNAPSRPESHHAHWRFVLHEVIFEADTSPGKLFDILLIICILISVVALMLDSIAGVHAVNGAQLRALEWFFTIIFTIEYALRLLALRRPWLYAKSFYGVVDSLGFIPTYISVVGYGIIAVPTGIVTAEMVQASSKDITTQACPTCSAEGHDKEARFCKYCGSEL